MTRALVSLVIPLSLGWYAAGAALPCAASHRLRAVRLFLGVGLGLGLCSYLFFVALLIRPRGVVSLLAAEVAALAVAVVLARAAARRSSNTRQPSIRPGPAFLLREPVWVVCGLTLLVAIGVMAIAWIRRPHGGADAWIQWNMRARFLFRGGERWTDLFSVSPLLHPDYPLLLPGLVARAWTYGGRESTVEPALLSALFALGTAGLLAAAVALHRGSRMGALAGMLLLGTSSFVASGAAQVADAPLGFYLLATLVLVSLSRVPDAGPGALVLAGMTAALAAWTKNEGILFVLVIGAVLVVGSTIRGERPPFSHGVLPFWLGALPGLVVVLVFKVVLAPRNDVVSARNLPLMVERMVDFERYAQVLAAVGREAIGFGRGAPVVLLLFALLLGRDRGVASASAGMLALAVVGLMAAGYGAIYIVTPHDLRWHLATSLERLLLQLWPSLIFAVFMLVRAPVATPAEG
ncbi:MAG TPA: hypothetical protein VLA19_27590 [Herpetosiphonaceae bacterium]|nr:hypothetical protein [Herpetosiphonaceae bacterium]